MGLISDDSWIWGKLCSMQSCAHSLRDHTIREGGVKQQFRCKNCDCNMYVKTTVNILVTM